MIKKLFTLLLAILLVSCGTTEKSDNTAATISVSILPQKYFVEQIAGDLFNINVMIPPGASPATYEPTPLQLTSLATTDIYLKIGYTAFEVSWMNKIISVNETMKVIDLSEGVDLIMEKTHQHGDHQHGSVDPHIWLSPKNARIISKNIYTALSEAYPEYESIFIANFKNFCSKLDSLDTYITGSLGNLEQVTFFTYHPALSYFSRDYGLHQHPMELEGKTPTATHMKELVDIGKSEEVKIIFLQMQFDQHNAEVLAKEIGAEIIQINPLDPEWDKQMVYITEKLKSTI